VTTETAPRSSRKTRDVSATFFASTAAMSSPPLESLIAIELLEIVKLRELVLLYLDG
jgi:hypothetical protein